MWRAAALGAVLCAAVFIGPIVRAESQKCSLDCWALGEDYPVAPFGEVRPRTIEYVAIVDAAPDEDVRPFVECVARNECIDGYSGAPLLRLWGQEHGRGLAVV